jgi:alpha-tubulin suppressor-like RCC1 family protein
MTDERVAEASQAVSVVLDVSVGMGQAFVRADDGALYGWGQNSVSQLGVVPATNRSSPVSIFTNGVVDVAGSWSHSCAVTGDGFVYCFGANGYNKAGGGSQTTPKATPTQIAGVSGAVAIATGSEHSCALRSSGYVSCWGFNGNKELGDGSTLQHSATPVQVHNLSDAIDIEAAGQSTCVLRSSGAVACWGNNWLGQLGDGTTVTRSAPVDVLGVSNATAITCGANHCCALLEDGNMSCWGSNGNGQLGRGPGSPGYSHTAAPVVGLDDIVAIGAGAFHTCAVRSDGTAYCWGADDGLQLGDGDNNSANELSPVPVLNLSGALAIDGGVRTTCAHVLQNQVHQVKCWGNDWVGTLGNGGTLPGTGSPSPVDVLLP